MAIHEMQALSALMQRDPEYAWEWFCNLSVPIMDATGVSNRKAGQAGAHIMQHMFGVDMTRDPRYVDGKSGAQNYAEFRIESGL